MTAPIGLVKLIWAVLNWTVRWAWKLVTAPFILIYLCLRAVIRATFATPRLIFVSAPVGAYRRAARIRNWITAKAEYLESESKKWRTAFNVAKSPYSFLTRTMGLSPPMAISMLLGLSTVAGGVAVNEALQPPSFANGDTGIYSAPSDVPLFFSESYNTLQLNFNIVPVKSINISDVSVGTAFSGSALPSGETTAVSIGGNADVATWLYVGTMTFSKNRCDTLTLSDINVSTLNITDNASDGQSLSPAAGTMRNRAVIGGHGMARMSTESGLYDRVHLQAPTSGVDGHVDALTISNVFSKGGDCFLSRIKGGTLTINQNLIGGDSSLDTKAFTVATSVTASVINLSGNTEVVLDVPATQTMDN